MCRLWNIAMHDYHESVNTRQTYRQTERRRTKWSLCAAILRRRRNKIVHIWSIYYLMTLGKRIVSFVIFIIYKHHFSFSQECVQSVHVVNYFLNIWAIQMFKQCIFKSQQSPCWNTFLLFPLFLALDALSSYWNETEALNQCENTKCKI